MIRCLSLALLVIFDDTLTRKILIFYEFYACISISNADVSLSNSSKNAIRSDVEVCFCRCFGNGSAVVVQEHGNVVSELVRGFCVTFHLCHE